MHTSAAFELGVVLVVRATPLKVIVPHGRCGRPLYALESGSIGAETLLDAAALAALSLPAEWSRAEVDRVEAWSARGLRCTHYDDYPGLGPMWACQA